MFPVKIFAIPIVNNYNKEMVLCNKDYSPICLDLEKRPISLIEEYIKRFYPFFTTQQYPIFLHKLSDSNQDFLSICYYVAGLNFAGLDKQEVDKLGLVLIEKYDFFSHNLEKETKIL